MTIFYFAKSFTDGKISADIFSEAYMELWRIETRNGIRAKDNKFLEECLSRIFCSADCYSPDSDRTSVEIDAEEFRHEVSKMIENFKNGKDIGEGLSWHDEWKSKDEPA
ncbi:MAG: colicin immunity domain-containing protein [Zoogloeaceae bacterium]|jgi:hypothetical protein|nr:colicin immunity domain-containing protein [Zoogloeaceae bacterium]